MALSQVSNSNFEYYYSPITNSSDESNHTDEVHEDIIGLNRDKLELTADAKREAEKEDRESGDSAELTKEEQSVIKEMKSRDREVRTHEQAHIAAGGQYVRGGASFSYQTGPDGMQYATGGEVSIDTSKVQGDPQATIQKMTIVRKAALAPADPSGADRSIAAQASQTMSAARKELAKEKTSPEEDGGNENQQNNNEYTAKDSSPVGSQIDLVG